MQVERELEELKKEYKEWKKDKRIEREQRALHVKGYTPEQVYLQIKKATDMVIRTAEDFLAEEDVAKDNSSDQAGNMGSAGDDGTDSLGFVVGDDQVDERMDIDFDDENSGDENDKSDREDDENDREDDDESEFDYNSEEMAKITEYLEGDCESSNEIMSMPAKEILGGTKRDKKYPHKE